jgi:hypothetical protein
MTSPRTSKLYCNSAIEAKELEQYRREKGVLIHAEFNTTHGLKGKLRALDAIRFPDLEKGVFEASSKHVARS